MINKRAWTPEQLTQLTKLARKIPVTEIAKLIGRTTASTENKLQALKISYSMGQIPLVTYRGDTPTRDYKGELKHANGQPVFYGTDGEKLEWLMRRMG